MIFEYSGRTADIEATPIGVRDDFYCVRITTSHDGTASVWPASVPVATLRNRATANNTDIQTERDAFIQQAIIDAQERFKDVVDLEVL